MRAILLGLVVAAVGLLLLVIAQSPQLESLAPSGLRTVGLIVGGLGAVSLFVGLVGYVVVPALRGTAPPSDRGSHRMILATTGLAILVSNLVAVLLLGEHPEASLRTLRGFLIAAVTTESALLALAWVRAVRPGILSWRALGPGGHGAGVLGWGLFGGLLVFGLSAAAQLVLQRFGVVQTQIEGFTWVRALPPREFPLIVVAGALLAPLAEEVFFRGYVFTSYRSRCGPVIAGVLSAILFGALHLNLQAFLPICLMGLLLAWLYQRTGSLIPGIIAHGMNNALAFMALYYFGMQ